MKKHLLWLSVVIVVALAAMNKQVRDVVAPAKPIEQSVSFAVYKEGSYASAIYSNTSAKVHVVIEKVSSKQRKTVWEKTFDAQTLKDYPSLQNAIAQTVNVPNVFNSKEHLEISYTLTYNSNGTELQMQNGVVINNNKDKVYIGI